MSLTSVYRAFIWDFDGTLYDTYPHTVRAYAETLAEYGFEGDAAEIERIARISLLELKRHLKARFGVPREYFEKVEARALELAIANAKPFPDARRFLEDVVGEGGVNLLFTHRDRTALDILESGDMLRLFADTVFDGDPDFVWKPSGKSIKALIRRNGLKKPETIMVGDREIDVESAAKAKTDSCLIMPYDITADSVATYKCESFAAFRAVLGGQSGKQTVN